MIKANFKTYASYVTDSLYQWDLNQVLSVYGLNLSVAPEVHFSNANMDKAIVRQASLKNNVVEVNIPNSLLQEPLTIKAHIGIYEGSTFKVIELVEIPVNPKTRPSDYRIQVTDEEIYSFKALENALANKADSAIINARIDNIIAHNNDTEGNTELLDIRTDINGNVHGTAGTAIRTQVDDIKSSKADNYTSDIILSSIDNKGMYDFISNNVYNGDALYKTYEVGGNQLVKVSGRSYSVNDTISYSLCACYDKNDTVLKIVGSSNNTNYSDVMFITPPGTVKIIVNGGSLTTVRTENYTIAELKICTVKTLKDTFDSLKTDDSGNLFYPVELNGESTDGFYNFDTNTITSGGAVVKTYTIEGGEILLISGKSRSVARNYNYALCGFFDENDNLLSVYGLTPDNNYLDFSVIAPTNAKKLIVNGGNGNDTSVIASVCRQVRRSIYDSIAFNNRWRNKKIGVIGTSVAFGSLAETSYPYEASKHLGFILKNFGVPGLAIHTDSEGQKLTYGSFTLSKAEYAEQGLTIPSAPISYTPNGSYNDYYRTYENVFVEDNADIDLWIYSVVPNNSNFDLSDWDDFDVSTWSYKDGSTFADHRSTFLGSVLFIMDKMYELNPNARMVLVLDSSFKYEDGKSNFELLKTTWNIPIIDLWGNINTSPKSLLKLKSEGGTNNHPSTFAHEIMGKMLSGQLNTIA